MLLNKSLFNCYAPSPRDSDQRTESEFFFPTLMGLPCITLIGDHSIQSIGLTYGSQATHYVLSHECLIVLGKYKGTVGKKNPKCTHGFVS